MQASVVLEIARLISQDSQEDLDRAQALAEEQKDKVSEEIKELLADSTEQTNFRKALLSEERINRDLFYKRVGNIAFCLGTGEDASKLVGFTWIAGYRRLNQEESAAFLSGLLETGTDIFILLPALPTFLANVSLETDFAAKWFLNIGQRIARDLAAGPFYVSIHTYAMHFPENAQKIIERYIEEGFEELKVDLSAIILGALRGCGDKGSLPKPSLSSLETRLKGHPKPNYRHCYNLSWIGYFSEGTVSIETLLSALDEMYEWTIEDVGDAFWVLSRCSNRLMDDSKLSVLPAINWFEENAKPDIPISAKRALTVAALSLYRKNKEAVKPISTSQIDTLLLKVLPLPENEEHLWHEIEFYLRMRLADEPGSIGALLRAVANLSGRTFIDLLGHHKFQSFLKKLSLANSSVLISELLLSDNSSERALGRALLEQIPPASLDSAIFEAKADTRRLLVLFLEIARYPLAVEAVADIFKLLFPYYENCEAFLRKEFSDEMTLQAINYPGKCLESWKAMVEPSPLLREVISRADAYFERLQHTVACPTCHITFPALRGALREWQRRFSNEVNEGARKASVFYPLVRHTDIIYGSEWSVAGPERVSDPKPFSTFLHETEAPRLEILDPEGML